MSKVKKKRSIVNGQNYNGVIPRVAKAIEKKCGEELNFKENLNICVIVRLSFFPLTS